MLNKRRGSYIKEPCRMISMRLPHSMLDELDKYCKMYKVTRTKFVIELIKEHQGIDNHFSLSHSQPQDVSTEETDSQDDWANRYLNE